MVDITLPRAVGADGVSPNLTAGSVSVGPLAVSITGTQANPVLNFVIPAGESPPWDISDTTGLQTALDAKAPLASPTFTGTVSGITAAMVGLGNVDNTSDASKPVSTATQTALNLKANLASPTFTGTVTLPAGQAVNGVTLSNAAGTTVFLRGDGTYATPSGGGGGSGDVVGPASATNNGVVLFDGTTGKLLKDGPLLSTYALLASPTFTGVPAAPTATAGTSTTQLATTAFVTTADALKANLSDTLNAQTGTTYTLVAGDNGKVVELSNASAITVTAPVLTSGFNVILRQTGAGQVTVVGSSVTIRNRQSYTKLAGTWAEASLAYRATNDAVLSGDVVA